MSEYKLSIASKGISVYNGTDFNDEGIRPVVVTNSKKAVIVYSSLTMTLTLYGVTFNRKIYEPGHIQAEVMIQAKDDAPGVALLSLMLHHRPVSLSVDDTVVAKNYYIHEITPQYESETKKDNDGEEYTLYSIYLKLDIFSMDKLLTLNKFSRAYLGQRLYGDIARDGISDFKLEYQINQVSGNEVSGIELSTDDQYSLQNLAYKASFISGKDPLVPREYIHPYLVQYNETFHEFLCRVANRCGEAFYFEDGKLCFGLSKTRVGPEISNPARIMFQRVSDSPAKVHEYARDSVKQWDAKNKTYDPGKDRIITDPVEERDENGFPEDAVATLPENAKKDFPYFHNSEIASEDHYLVLYKDKFARDGYGYTFWGDTGEHLMSMLSDVLNSTSLLDLLASWAVNTGISLLRGAARFGKATKAGNELLAQHVLENGMDSAVMFAKVDTDPDHWVTLKYSANIKENEEKQMRKMVCLDMGETVLDVRLGDKIKLPFDADTPYIVVGVDMVSSIPWQRKYDGLSFGGPKTVALTGNRVQWQSQVIHAVPMYNNGTSNKPKWAFYPPLLPGNPFRESGPQPAFIIDSSDPSGQGRVRIRFPWQPSLKPQDDLIQTYKDKLKKARTDSSPIRTKLQACAVPDSIKIKDGVAVAKKRPDVDSPNYDGALKTFQEKVTDYYNKKTGASEQEMLAAREELEKYATSIEVKDGVVFAEKRTGITDKKFKTELQAYQEAVDAIYAANALVEQAEVKKTMLEAGSPWIRMATPMATSGGGMYFKPEKGDEVMVGFENGNVERPYVIGNLYSKNVTAPSEGSRVIVSKNGHTIKMSDPSDGTLFLAGMYPGFKFLNSFGVEFPDLKGKMNSVLGGIEMTDKYGIYNIKMSSHDRNISISSPFGDVNLNAFTGISITAPNGDISITGKNVEIAAFDKLTLTSGKNVKADDGYFAYLRSMASISGIGKALERKALNATVGKFFDLTLLRSIVEVFVRPVNGTLQIKSHRYMMLEGGKGSVHVPAAFYKPEAAAKMLRGTEAQLLVFMLDHIGRAVDDYTSKYISLFNQVRTDLNAIPDAVIPQSSQPAPNPPAFVSDPADKVKLLVLLFQEKSFPGKDREKPYFGFANHGVKKKIQFANPAPAPAPAPGVAPPAAPAPGPSQKEVLKQIDTLLESVWALRKHVEKYKEIMSGLDKATTSYWNRFRTILPGKLSMSLFEDDLKQIMILSPFPVLHARVAGDSLYDSIQTIKKFIDNNTPPAIGTAFGNQMPVTQFDDFKKFLKRRLAHSIIEKCRKNPGLFSSFTIPTPLYPVSVPDPANPGTMLNLQINDVVSPFTDSDWAAYRAAIVMQKKEQSVWDKVKSSDAWEILKDATVKKSYLMEKNVWGPEAKGEILLSNSADRTYQFDASGHSGYLENAEYGDDLPSVVNKLKEKINF